MLRDGPFVFRRLKKEMDRWRKKGFAQDIQQGHAPRLRTKAAVWMLFSGEEKTSVDVVLPKGKELTLLVCEIEMKRQGEKIERVSCAVRKDSGDDPDITNGIFVYASVRRKDGTEIEIDGGRGVGRVTKKGLDQPAGAAAINKVPRR